MAERGPQTSEIRALDTLAHRVTRELNAGFVFAHVTTRPSDPGMRSPSGEPCRISRFGIDGGALGMLSYTRLQAIGYLLG